MTARTRWSLLVGLTALLAAGRASAQTTCNTDLDCPGTSCGGQVCTKSSGGTMCNAPDTVGASGVSDGWCNADTDCKCRSLGASCNGFFCTFTVPPDGGVTGTGGSTGSGGSTGTAGTTGAGGSGTGGATGSAGSGGGGGGCSVAGAPSLGGSLGVALLAAALMRRRGRRRI